MFEQYNQMAQVIINYLRGHLKKEETTKLNEWLNSDPDNRPWLEELDKEDWLETTIGDFRPLPPNESFNNTMLLVKQYKVVKIKRSLTAAAVILATIIGIYLLNTGKRKAPEHNVVQHTSGDTRHSAVVIPNTNHAILTLADGTTVDVDNANGEIATNQGNYKIAKVDSFIKYVYNPAGKATALAYNTLKTPNGSQHQVILPDGSKAWLNAASSLKYLVTDTGRTRRVAITGQVYFEVYADPSRPFIVSANGAQVKAVGTHFNVTAYANESKIQTDLLEGKVEITTANRPATHLDPGQSATIIPGKSITVFTNSKIDDAIAWKNGQFVFDEESVPSIMRKLSRWYDMEVSYIDTPNVLIDGSISRKNPVQNVLRLLEAGNVYTVIEDRKIKVSSHEITE
jgi:transmembrane sensor